MELQNIHPLVRIACLVGIRRERQYLSTAIFSAANSNPTPLLD